MTVNVEIKIDDFVNIVGQRVAALEVLRDGADVLVSALQDEVPVDKGDLRDSIKVRGSGLGAREIGENLFFIEIESEEGKAPYWPIVLHGHDEMMVGQPGKIYSPALGIVWVGPWTLPQRPPNDFRQRALDKALPRVLEIIGNGWPVRAYSVS